jgi:hypothetical protein
MEIGAHGSARHTFGVMPYTPSYTTPEAVDEFLGDEEGTCTEEEVRLAELDTDYALLSVGTFNETTGLKLTPSRLTNRQQILLARAVAEQIRYRRLLGPNAEEFMAVREYKETNTEGGSRKGRRPKYSDVAKDYLRRARFTPVRRVGRSRRLTWQEFKELKFEDF